MIQYFKDNLQLSLKNYRGNAWGGSLMCRVRVVMPVYNEEKYLADAVDSILLQTFSDFILIAVDDCSTDDSLAILHSYRDERIQIVENDQHKGITHVLNQGLSHAEGDLIFRMDADDISLPQRLQRQIDFMQNHPQVFACGSDTDLINETGKVIGHRDTKKGDQRIKIALFLGETSLAHPSVVMRSAAMKAYQLQYSEKYPYAEDYELWCRCSTFSIYENIPEVLLQYRHHNKSVSKAFAIRQRLFARQILATHLYRLGLNATPEELNCHMQFALSLDQIDMMPTKSQFIQWKNTLINWNRHHRLFEPTLFESELEWRYQKALDLWR